MSSGKIVLGILVGAAAGALVGILFAPDKGSKTRRRILKKGDNLYDSSKEKIDELIDAVIEKFEQVMEEVIDYAENVKDQVSDYAEKVICDPEGVENMQK